MHGVQQKLDELKSTNLIAPNLSLSSVLQTRTAELRVLREVVLKSELDFYNSFDRLKGLPPRQALDTLQMLVGVWNASGVRHMISDSSTNTVLAILSSPEYRRLGVSEIEDVFNDYLNSPEGAYMVDMNLEALKEFLKNKLNEALKDANNPALSVSQRTGKGLPTTPYVYFDITQDKNGKLVLKINSNLKGPQKSKIKKAFRLFLEKELANTQQLSEANKNTNMLQKIILQPITNAEVREAVKRELEVGRVGMYNLSREFSVIKGFLGEVYWSALFSFLGARTTPVGDEKDKTTGQSIGIDLVVGAYGFQMKNFNMKNNQGVVQFGSRGGLKQAGTFIQDRAKIDGQLGELLLDLYGAYAYNSDSSLGEFTETRKELEEYLTKDASQIFTHYIDRIIRLDMQQEPKNISILGAQTTINNKKTLFNSFFLIGEKIIPSSAILDEIILALTAPAKTPISFQITDLTADASKITYPKKVDWQSKKMANYTKLAYSINFDTGAVLDEAYKKFV